MFNFRPTYQPLTTFCKELIAEKKVLMEENEELKETLRCIRQDNQELRAKLFSKPNDDKLADLEKRVSDLEEQLANKVFLLDDEGTPIKSFTLTGKLTVKDEPAKEKLEVGKWYHTTDFTKEELEKLLPKETTILVEKKVLYENIGTTPPTETKKTTVKRITTANFSEITLIEIDTGDFLKEWFKIIEE